MPVIRECFMQEWADHVAAVLRDCHVRCAVRQHSRAIREEPFVEWTYRVSVAAQDRELAERVLRSRL